MTSHLSNLWCVRAESGAYTKAFVAGGYIAIDYDLPADLSSVSTREEIVAIYRAAHPKESSNIVIAQQAGQIARFLLEMDGQGYIPAPKHGRAIPLHLPG